MRKKEEKKMCEKIEEKIITTNRKTPELSCVFKLNSILGSNLCQH